MYSTSPVGIGEMGTAYEASGVAAANECGTAVSGDPDACAAAVVLSD